MRIAGSRVLITGAGRGLGLAIAEAFAKAGAKVIVTDRSTEGAKEAAAKLPGACGYTLDVTNAEQIADVRTRLNAEHGPIDILVNNAGVVFGGAFLDVPLAKHLTTVNVNLAGLVAVTHCFLPDLITRPAAHLVNISSASAVIALPMGTTYAASKWAVLGFTESVREELWLIGHRHVGVTAICPSFISTGLFGGARPANMTNWLAPEAVAAAVVRAVEKRREFVMMPWPARLMYRLCAGLPRGVYRRICRTLGVSHSMTDWQGHGEPK
jgi:short-subunit dehydrogenase